MSSVKRSGPRYQFTEVVSYRKKEVSSPNEKLYGISINISESGLCLYTSNSLDIGEKIEISTSRETRHIKATVRWTKKYLDGLYRVGVMFNSAGDYEQLSFRT